MGEAQTPKPDYESPSTSPLPSSRRCAPRAKATAPPPHRNPPTTPPTSPPSSPTPPPRSPLPSATQSSQPTSRAFRRRALTIESQSAPRRSSAIHLRACALLRHSSSSARPCAMRRKAKRRREKRKTREGGTMPRLSKGGGGRGRRMRGIRGD